MRPVAEILQQVIIETGYLKETTFKKPPENNIIKLKPIK